MTFLLKNRKPQSIGGKTLLWTCRILSLMALLYLVPLLYPQVFFSHQFTKHGFTVYSHQPIPPTVEQRLDEVYEIIRNTEIYDPTVKARIFACNSLGWYRLFYPTYTTQYSISRRPFGQKAGHIFIARADLVRNKTGAPDIETSWRSFTGVCAHELFHQLIANAVEKRGYDDPPEWVVEGYCEYASGNISLPESVAQKVITGGTEFRSSTFAYYKRNKTVQYLVEQKNLDFDGLINYANQHSEDDAWRDTAQWLKKNILAPRQNL